MLKKYIKNTCINLLEELSSLKEKILSESVLLNRIDTITHLKNQLTHLISKIKYIKKTTLIEKHKNNLTTLTTNDNKFTIKIKNNFVFYVDTKNIKLNNLIIKKINEETNDENFLNKLEECLDWYVGYEKVKCDECLMIKDNKEEYPFVKVRKEGVLFSFHENCYKKIN
ncbi:hypothetical protein TUBRATIS_15130 [Tubulinosema ratisbonensis]|uniref:Uncharacterized protein n=1 Tax=Tubulinosema ratisbonensis TaxID=291195 RepID=A0A437ALP4_9MICR|nr:hypothetical protein TUBRATIS_15130 [Tubulinosema ratisbonensis]